MKMEVFAVCLTLDSGLLWCLELFGNFSQWRSITSSMAGTERVFEMRFTLMLGLGGHEDYAVVAQAAGQHNAVMDGFRPTPTWRPYRN
jgi:hypothetical protein